MSDTAIKIEALSKSYMIRHAGGMGRYVALRDVLANKAKQMAGMVARPFASRPKTEHPKKQEEFWALDDVSLEIKQGDRIGIIGRNGAGKSTLLKILSRITAPTKGSIDIYGRVGSLLEVGTGFHPELTGRENIYLNGAILGMHRAEIRKKFDEIVAFAEVEKFLDTPVKRYSSGMYVRLAFAVAAHLEPEILIVDEVLAVGDAQFQKKCLGKMGEVSTGGRTVLFVSHNMAAIQALCNKGVVLNRGCVEYNGVCDQAIDLYMESGKANAQFDSDSIRRIGNGSARVVDLIIKNKNGEKTNILGMGECFSIDMVIEGALKNAVVGAIIGDDFLGQIMRAYSYETYKNEINLTGQTSIRISFDFLPLVQGTYSLSVWVGIIGEVADYIENAVEIIVESRDIFLTGKQLNKKDNKVFCYHTWQIEPSC